MSPKQFVLIVLACLVKDAFYADAAPSITRNELTDDEMPMTAPVQIESPTPMDHLPGAQDGEQRQVDQMERDAQAKGPLSGLVPGAGGTTTATQAPATTTPPGSGLFGGLPGIPGGGLPGIPGGGLPQGDGQNPTLVLGGFSILLLPMKGMSLSNMASMLSTGQQLGQMLPKPGP